MTTDAPAIYVATYLLDGHPHATLHREGCKILEDDRRTAEAHISNIRTPNGKQINRMAVFTLDRYERLRQDLLKKLGGVKLGGLPDPVEHSCMRTDHALPAPPRRPRNLIDFEKARSRP